MNHSFKSDLSNDSTDPVHTPSVNESDWFGSLAQWPATQNYEWI